MPSSTNKSATTVKFLSLPIGEKFRWQGTVYVKTSPLIARDEASKKTQLIQRAALVEPLDAHAAARTAKAANASQAVLEEYHQVVLSGLDNLTSNTPSQSITQLRKKLDEAHRRARKKLSNNS